MDNVIKEIRKALRKYHNCSNITYYGDDNYKRGIVDGIDNCIQLVNEKVRKAKKQEKLANKKLGIGW